MIIPKKTIPIWKRLKDAENRIKHLEDMLWEIMDHLKMIEPEESNDSKRTNR